MVQLGVRRGDVWHCYTQVKPSNYSEQEVSQLHPVTDWVVRHEEPLLLEDVAAHYRRFLSELPQWKGLPSAGSCLALPLASKPGVNSWLMLVTTAEFPLSEAQMEFVRALVPYVAVSLDNARIYLDLDREKQKADTLLHNILPKEVAEELKAKGKTEARLFEHVTVLFTDFVNFTGTSERMSPHELVEELDACFKAFDLIMEKHGLEKIKTIGDAYMAVSGLPVERPDHARAAVEAAREILAYVNWRRNEGTLIFDIRIGLHTGPVVAGIVGHTKFAYDIWGDAVNVASRMENTGEVGRIHISEAVYNLVKDHILCEYRG
jgi:class 3 adenylate cyclase